MFKGHTLAGKNTHSQTVIFPCTPHYFAFCFPSFRIRVQIHACQWIHVSVWPCELSAACVLNYVLRDCICILTVCFVRKLKREFNLFAVLIIGHHFISATGNYRAYACVRVRAWAHAHAREMIMYFVLRVRKRAFEGERRKKLSWKTWFIPQWYICVISDLFLFYFMEVHK